MNSIEPFAILLDWLRAVLSVGERPLPPPLVDRVFAWTGSSAGPAPPIEDRA